MDLFSQFASTKMVLTNEFAKLYKQDSASSMFGLAYQLCGSIISHN